MTHVNWHPVEVNEYGKIIKGRRPFEMTSVFITYRGDEVDTQTYIDDTDGFGNGCPNPYLKTIIAWAYADMPEPYQPELENE